MPTTSDLDGFADELAELELTEAELAVAALWHADHSQKGVSIPISELAQRIHGAGLTGPVNKSRFAAKLRRHPDLVTGDLPGTVKLRAAARLRLDGVYSVLVGRRRHQPSDSVVSQQLFATRRQVWKTIVSHMNACYDLTYYDAAAVLGRRLMESLLIAAYEKRGECSAIRNAKGEYEMLERIIAVAMSGTPIKLARTSQDALTPIKRVGDVAAHSPHHITTKTDLDGIAQPLRALVSNLLNLIDGK